jgi:hypothetical protein
MTQRTVVIRKKSYGWQPNIKRKTQIKIERRAHSAGFISPVFVVLAFAVFAGLFYVYAVNQTAVKGLEIRKIEKEIAESKKNNEALKIREAELKSLYKIEESSKNLNMVDAANVKYLEENPSVAFSQAQKSKKIE